MAQRVAREFLVTPEWLHSHLNDPNVRVVDGRPPDQYAQGHIPGATNVDFTSIGTRDTSAEGVRAWTARMEEAFSAAGLGEGQTVVFYEDTSGYNAARGVWALVYFGQEGGRLLDGGLNAWRAAGYPVTTEAPPSPPNPGGEQPGRFRARPRPDELAGYEYLLACLNDGVTQIVDTRRPTEYAGTEIRSARGGRIPGAIPLDWVNNLDAAGRLKPAAELEAMYAGLGLDRNREVVTYCQGGYRAAHTWLVLRMLGYPRVRNYLGSWGEWGNREGLPIENLTLPDPAKPA
jgi:thiosulfate/3-mercaptopyruvate sulfurtransferase